MRGPLGRVPFNPLPHRGIAIRRHFVLWFAFQAQRLENQAQRFAGHVNHQQVVLALQDLPAARGRGCLGEKMIFL